MVLKEENPDYICASAVHVSLVVYVNYIESIATGMAIETPPGPSQ